MAARPPGLGARLRVDERIVRAVPPRAVDRARARRDHHMAGRRSRSAADRGDQVIIVTVVRDLRPLGRKTLDHPVGGIAPRSEEQTSEITYLMRTWHACICLKKKKS